MEAVLRRWPRLEQRCFTCAERAYCNSQRRPGQHFAARIAANEAVAKALRVPVRWREIEVIGAGGPPAVVLVGKTLAAAGGRKVLVSVSHSAATAVAAAVARGDER